MRLEYFQMITRVVEFDADKKTLVAAADVPAESPVFEGHFPGYPLLPGVPPVAETVAGFEVTTWNGVFAPAATPPATIERISSAIAAVMAEP